MCDEVKATICLERPVLARMNICTLRGLRSVLRAPWPKRNPSRLWARDDVGYPQCARYKTSSRDPCRFLHRAKSRLPESREWTLPREKAQPAYSLVLNPASISSRVFMIHVRMAVSSVSTDKRLEARSRQADRDAEFYGRSVSHVATPPPPDHPPSTGRSYRWPPAGRTRQNSCQAAQ